jgi:hypothetical protein
MTNPESRPTPRLRTVRVLRSPSRRPVSHDRAARPSGSKPEAACLPLGLLLTTVGTVGAIYQVPTLPVAVVAVLAGTAYRLARRRPRALLLSDFWLLSFAYLLGSEVVMARASVMQDFGKALTGVTEGFIVAAFGASLLGYAGGCRLIARARPQRPELRPAGRPLPRMAASLVALSTVILGGALLVLSPAALVAGRGALGGEVGGQKVVVFAALMVVHGILVARAVTVSRRMRWWMAYGMLVSVLSVAVLYANGTRFYLGFMIGGMLFYFARFMQPLSRRRLVGFALALVILTAVQGSMRFFRQRGLGAVDAGALATALSDPETHLSNENMLRVNAWVHLKRVYEYRDVPSSHAFLLYWWVPRSVWPSKPTMDGYWVAREVMADVSVSAGHSVAGGFALGALLDFGPHLGVLFCLTYGLVLAALEWFALRNRDPSRPTSVVAALLPFGVFFAVRSPQTSAIFLQGCVAIAAVVLVAAGAGRRRRPVGVRAVRRVATGGPRMRPAMQSSRPAVP